MKKRFLLFGFGVLLGIVFLSLGPENRLKNTFYSYLDYFDIDKRVITHLRNDNTAFTPTADCQLVYYGLNKSDILSVLDDGEVNFDLSDKDSSPCQYYMIENQIRDNKLYVKFEYCFEKNTVRVMGFTVDNDQEVCDL